MDDNKMTKNFVKFQSDASFRRLQIFEMIYHKEKNLGASINDVLTQCKAVSDFVVFNEVHKVKNNLKVIK